jgi:hypothetical protein
LRVFREGFVFPSDAQAGLYLLEATSYTLTPLCADVARREVVGASAAEVMTLPFFFVVVAVVVDEKGRTTDRVVVVRARASSLKFVAAVKSARFG